MNADNQAERNEVLRRLEEQRQRIKALFDKSHAPRTGMVNAVQNGFPRSQAMRLLMSEPVFAAGLSTLAGRLLGPSAMQLLRAFASAFRAVLNAGQERGTQPP